MYILLKRGRLKEIVIDAIKKAGSEKQFLKIINIPRSKIWKYKTMNVALNEERINKFLDYLNISLKEEYIEKRLPNNWRQKIGGIRAVELKKEEGNFEMQLSNCRKKAKTGLHEWHKKCKITNPEGYYLAQYEKFKKIAEYKYTTKNGEKVRNALERDTADKLKSLGMNYKYEPLIKVEGKYFFPDFLINNKIIIECTMWRGYDKAIKLKEKIRLLEKEYKVYVVIPEKLNKYYQSLNDNLIEGLDNFKEIIKRI